MCLRHRLKPNGLPDAGGRRVPNAFGIGDLLAARLRALVGGVVDADYQFLLALFRQRVGDIETKTVVPALVDAEFLAVDPDGSVPIHSTEVEKNSLAGPSFRHGEGAAVPKAVGVFH